MIFSCLREGGSYCNSGSKGFSFICLFPICIECLDFQCMISHSNKRLLSGCLSTQASDFKIMVLVK